MPYICSFLVVLWEIPIYNKNDHFAMPNSSFVGCYTKARFNNVKLLQTSNASIINKKMRKYFGLIKRRMILCQR